MPDENGQATPLEKMKQRTGHCLAVGGCSCSGFEFKIHTDGFPHCVCNHTQWAHERVTILS